MSLSVSLTKATKKTNIKHNNRVEKVPSKNIDLDRSHENNYLVQKNLRELYREEFDQVLEKYNSKQKRKDRKIDNYYEHIKASKKVSLQQEMIIQVGDKDDFQSEGGWKIANEILVEWFQEFQERNPNLKIYNAVIHNDEASPHLHINFVPVAGGYKRGLEKQVAFDRAIIQQDSKLNKVRPFDDWRENEVNLVADLLKKRGIERKLVGTNQYKDVNDYKVKKDLEKEIYNLIEKRDEIRIEVDSGINKIESLMTEEKKDNSEFQMIDTSKVEQLSIPVVNFRNSLSRKRIADEEEVNRLIGYTNRLKGRTSDLANKHDELTLVSKKLLKTLKFERESRERLIEDRMSAERQKWAQERFEHDRQVGSMWSVLEELESENTALKQENSVLQRWKNRAIEFMDKINVYDKFKNIINNKFKGRNQDMER